MQQVVLSPPLGLTQTEEPVVPNKDGLDDNFTDRLVAISKAAVSLAPLVGGPLSEAIGAVIRGQRSDRIAAYLRALAVRVQDLEEQVCGVLQDQPEKIGVIEEGAFQAARATSSNRIALIVEAVAQGLDGRDAETIRRNRLLRLLGDIDDDEVALLNAHGRAYGTGDYRAFDDLNEPEPTDMQSSVEDLDGAKLYKAGEEHLLQLGLLQKNYGSYRNGDTPKFNFRLGDYKHSIEISYLGRMLLREIGLTPPFDAAERD